MSLPAPSPMPLAPAPAPAPESELEHTKIHRRWALGFIVFFLLVLTGVPLADLIIPMLTREVKAQSLCEQIPVLRMVLNPLSWHEYPLPIHTSGHVVQEPSRRTEQDLEAGSVTKQWLQPRVQEWLTINFSTGNNNVIIGRDGWLFYRPGIDHLAGHGFLQTTSRRTNARYLDPQTVIIDFHRQCQSHGVGLLVVPISEKAAIDHRQLTSFSTSFAGVHHQPANADFATWLRALSAAGVQVMPVDDLLREAAQHAKPFLPDDTHWTPSAMDAVARHIAHHFLLQGVIDTKAWQTEQLQITGQGDLTALLRLPRDSALFPPYTITIEKIIHPTTGAPWETNPTASVLLLGDSFSNIYQSPSLGWGESAGFGAHLAKHLGCDIDVIAVNGDGANGARRRLAMRQHPLKEKRVIIWAFAERELSNAQWSLIDLGKNEDR